ncbi:cilia- and flagella-associated protein 69 [Xiphophorus hellerii]|uniref:cilia- and flagella-associated protein 69 n=1 Tax=Xiphophorus hellerii TaxID=8084 RepID=UPI0013B3E3E6|nr:cilia- and flagella-associated protein 69 [Xiphophorus hellerii]XP_032436130.1 cilia- and flagella-associated protein 69 [Xiphophorus hellerii]
MDLGQTVSRENTEIPGINLSASFKIKNVQEASPKSLDLMKILYLLQDPLTTNLTGRHLFVLRKVLKRNKFGFHLRELADIARIIDICAEKVIERPKYASFLCEVLKISRIPFLKEKVSDDLIYAQDAINFLSCLGRLMKIPNPDIQEQVVEMVQSFFSSEAFKILPEDSQTVSPVYRLQLVERSDLPKLLVESVAALQNQPFIKLQLMETLQLLCSSSDLNCRSMLDAGAAQIVCLHMNGGDPPGRVLSSSSEILWTLLDSSGRDDAVAQLCSLDCVVSLKEAFSSVLALTSQGFDLQLRNYLLVFTSLIAENPNCPLVESLFAKQLLGYITLPELEISSAQKLTHSKEDLKMKKLLLNLLILLSRNVDAVQLFREELVMVSLLRFVNPPEKQPPSPQRAILSQQEELQLQALETLVSIAPVMLQDYMSCKGNTQLLLLLDWCCDARDRRKQQMQRCIRVLRAVTSLGEQSVNHDLSDQGAIHQLLGIIIQLEADCDEGDVVTIEMMSNIQLILSALCETDMHRKELFGSEGVEMVVHFLKKGAKNFYSGLGYNKLLISTIDCVWSCVIGCCITENEFLWKDGTGLLLDLLRSSPRCVHSIILSILLDLCNNPNTRPLVLGWRDADGLTAPGVLLQLWREEEEELGVLRDKNGGIVDPEKPLLTRFQDEICNLTFPANAPSAAVLETMENLRGKIYLLLSNLGFQDLPGLSVGDHVTLGIVRRYLDFKVCEVWNEIRKELSLDGVKPITSDEKALHSISKTLTEAAQSVMVEQSRVLEEQKQQEIQEEMRVYTEMKSHRTQQELAAKSWEKLVARTSNYNILKEEKAQRKKHLKSKLRPREAVDDRRQKHFITHILAVKKTGEPGPAGVDVSLARTVI